MSDKRETFGLQDSARLAVYNSAKRSYELWGMRVQTDCPSSSSIAGFGTTRSVAYDTQPNVGVIDALNSGVISLDDFDEGGMLKP